MYEIYYNFQAEPFRLSPDHHFCFEHKGYARAGAYMAYAYRRAEGFVMITGRPGTGKTTLIGDLVESLSSDNVYVANLVCTQLQADDLLKSVAYSFEIGSVNIDKAELLHRLTVLLHRWHRANKRALLIVDEAQDLSPSAMEELRLLTNIQLDNQPLLQVFLVGQPELRDLVLRPEMEQVHQRIVAASHIDSIDPEETEGYVMHRLQVVGWKGDPSIERGIFPLIHKFSEGVPRRINLICSRLFLLGSVEDRHTIELKDVAVVIGELQTEGLAAGTEFSPHDFQSPEAADWVSVPADAAVGAVEAASEPPPPVSDTGNDKEVAPLAGADGGEAGVEPASQDIIAPVSPDPAVEAISAPEVPRSAPASSTNPQSEAAEPAAVTQRTDAQETRETGRTGEEARPRQRLPERRAERNRGAWPQRLSGAIVVFVVLFALLYVAYDVSPPALKRMVSGLVSVGQAEPESAIAVAPGGTVKPPYRATVKFAPLTGVLDEDARDRLDEVVSILRDQSASLVYIAPPFAGDLYADELFAARFFVVQRYLVAAGVGEDRVKRTDEKLGARVGAFSTPDEALEAETASVYITLDNKSR
ncbi:AAA family ATPase [Candidatus Marimicrobium litorale]|uniref:DUF2075 domain-containing protein n=1 Tax=Candidatus Marimicrobium litorale TaxID=2518991 RepID=A0ABT3T301_9GAMM|nr:AAA family ATPase [Candidatus Marimicrobium litorale]MCX2975899.1 DUF2075 domain-containing protein [Candidatus Marimicrobium litorale]